MFFHTVLVVGDGSSKRITQKSDISYIGESLRKVTKGSDIMSSDAFYKRINHHDPFHIVRLKNTTGGIAKSLHIDMGHKKIEPEDVCKGCACCLVNVDKSQKFSIPKGGPVKKQFSPQLVVPVGH